MTSVTTPPPGPDRDPHPRPSRRARIAGILFGLALAVPTIRWLIAHQLQGNRTAIMAIGAVVGVMLVLVSWLGKRAGLGAGAAIAIALGAVVAIVQLRDSNPSENAPSTTPPITSLVACEHLNQQPQQITELSTARQVRISFPTVTFQVTGSDQMHIQLAGRIMGRLPDDMHLYLVQRADPDSRDSTPQHNPGDGNHYVVDRVTADQAGCWSTVQRKLGYSGARGLDFQYFLALIPTAAKARFEEIISSGRNDAPDYHGLTDEDLRRLGVRKVAVFEVRT